MTEKLKIALAQVNLTVGDFSGNKDKILSYYDKVLAQNADLVVYPELCISGYPPEDLVLRKGFTKNSQETLDELIIATAGRNTAMVISAPINEGGKIYNALFVAENGRIIHQQYKHDLPNYGVFDEKRVFDSGQLPAPFEFRGARLGIFICEDMWNMKVTESLRGSDIVISVNASPFEVGKHKKRINRAEENIDVLHKPIIYMNQICGHDDLVFDGDSFVISRGKELLLRLSRYGEELAVTNWNKIENEWVCGSGEVAEYSCNEQVVYQAMMLGLKDYVEKNHFPGVIIGMSGGVDSALSAAIAVDALGADKVRLVMMPSRYTSEESVIDAEKCARNLGVELETISIEDAFEAFEDALSVPFSGKERDVTEENLQSRIRGVLLMALSNKFGHMVLSTGNKSEMSVGYATLYGDMCGGYNVLKDAYKGQVFALCKWRNGDIPEGSKGAEGEVIPQNIITKPPTAELRHDQKDEDSLPPYDVLDDILHQLIEQEKCVEDIISGGHDREVVERICHLLYISEYKRRQSPPGVKISPKPFSRDRRYPITNRYR